MASPDEPDEQTAPTNADASSDEAPGKASLETSSEAPPPSGLETSSEAAERVTGGGCLPPARWSGTTPDVGESLEGSADSRKVTPGLRRAVAAAAAQAGRTREDGRASPSGAEPEAETPEEEPAAPRRFLSRFEEPPEVPIPVPVRDLRRRTRRDFLLFGAGTAAAAAAFWWVLPDGTQDRILTQERREWLDSMEARGGFGPKAKEKFLNRALSFDDDVAEALYSRNRRVRTYRKSDITPLRNNYDGQTPDPGYIPDWTLEVDGLASGRTESFRIEDLLSRFRRHDQITRLCCVEGWSAIAWWGGVRFADFLQAHPPAPGFRWAKLESSVNLDSDGDPDPYFVSIDLETARHPQTLLATHQNDWPLTVEHGAPLRLLVPMKLGLKNIKAVTKIAYSREEPPDYWNLQGYSKYDGL